MFPRHCTTKDEANITSLASRCMPPILEKPQFDFITDSILLTPSPIRADQVRKQLPLRCASNSVNEIVMKAKEQLTSINRVKSSHLHIGKLLGVSLTRVRLWLCPCFDGKLGGEPQIGTRPIRCNFAQGYTATRPFVVEKLSDLTNKIQRFRRGTWSSLTKSLL